MHGKPPRKTQVWRADPITLELRSPNGRGLAIGSIGHFLTVVLRMALTLLVAGLLGTGCSGDEQDVAATTSGRTTTEESFIAGATALCEEAAAQAAQIPVPNTLAQLEEVVAQVTPLNEEWNRRTEALPVPAGKEEEWRELLELLPQDEALLEDLGDAAAANDLAEVQRVNDRLMAIGRKEDAIWREVGVPACTRIRLGQPSV